MAAPALKENPSTLLKGRIIIVDDEPSIRKTIEGILNDEGYGTAAVGTAQDLFNLMEKESPLLVLLDIWLPGMDGIETLERLRQLYPNVPVVMMSGHATIATAMKATKLGAADFIEKPIDLELLLKSIRSALGGENRKPEVRAVATTSSGIKEQPRTEPINKIALSNQVLPGRSFTQRTLKNSALLYGQGLHTGKKSGLILEPLPAGSGIHFAEVSESEIVPAHVDFVDSTGFATTVKFGNSQAGTIEHLMSALHAYGICNLLIKCNGEVPVMDGSAIEFCNLFDNIGVEDQGEPWKEIAIDKTYHFGSGKEEITLEPADEFSVHYTLIYPPPVGTQEYEYVLGDIESYKKEIASARTFGFVKDIGWLQKQGLALGGRFDNFVLFGDEGAINCALRFDNEPVRHKILDAIGDLYLLGRRLRGRVKARMTGHSDNVAILKQVRQRLAELSK
jgi:UDP-3-O-[3-hydroxymyristoyl] N-acetylglucosamine deacetylase